MKKQIKIANSLFFDKETVAKLDENQLKEVAGGGSISCNAGDSIEDIQGQDVEAATWSLICGFKSCCDHSC